VGGRGRWPREGGDHKSQEKRGGIEGRTSETADGTTVAWPPSETYAFCHRQVQERRRCAGTEKASPEKRRERGNSLEGRALPTSAQGRMIEVVSVKKKT